MVTKQEQQQKEADKILEIFNHLRDEDNLKRLKSNLTDSPHELWNELNELVAYAHTMHTNLPLQVDLAKIQLQFMKNNWLGKPYPQEYLAKEKQDEVDRTYWKASNALQRQSSKDSLNLLKSWREPGKHANNFYLNFLKVPGVKSQCEFMPFEDFEKLDIDATTLAQICAYLHVNSILNTIEHESFNFYRRLDGNLTQSNQDRIDALRLKLGSESFYKKITAMFDRLVLEQGYNPMILQG